jgi:non-specific serine/threonine protein kinase
VRHGTSAIAIVIALASSGAAGCGGDAGAVERWRTLRDATMARTEVTPARIGDGAYVVGGFAGPGGATTAVVERYVPARRRWERLPAMRKPRGGVAAATVDGQIVVVGGEEPAGTISQVESYAPRRRRWRSEPPLPTSRHGLAAVSYRGSIVVLEGGPTPGLSFSDATEALAIRG